MSSWDDSWFHGHNILLFVCGGSRVPNGPWTHGTKCTEEQQEARDIRKKNPKPGDIRWETANWHSTYILGNHGAIIRHCTKIITSINLMFFQEPKISIFLQDRLNKCGKNYRLIYQTQNLYQVWFTYMHQKIMLSKTNNYVIEIYITSITKAITK
jgi:hypothetical protein